MTPPGYQDTTSERIPVVRNSVTVKVIAGESIGTKGVIDTRIPILYLHVSLEPGGEFTQAIPQSQNAFAFVVEGQGEFGGQAVSIHGGSVRPHPGRNARGPHA